SVALVVVMTGLGVAVGARIRLARGKGTESGQKRTVGGAPAKRGSGSPLYASRAANTWPACGQARRAAGVMPSWALVMYKVSRSGPPSAGRVDCAAGTATTTSSLPSGR